MKKIPHIVHFYWDGSRMAYLQYLTVVSFHKWNPDWEINVYSSKSKYEGKVTWKTHEQQDAYTGIDYFPMFKRLPYVNFVTVNFDDYNIQNDIPETYKSDLLRWHLLLNTGGLWSDLDILYTKPISALVVPSAVELTVSKFVLSNLREFHIIGFYLTVPNHPFFKKIVDNAPSYLRLDNYQSVGSSLLNTLYPTYKEIQEVSDGRPYAMIGLDVVYSYPPFDEIGQNQLPSLFMKKDLSRITKNTIGLHWYNGHAMAKQFNNEFNHLTMNQFDNTITHFIEPISKESKIAY